MSKKSRRRNKKILATIAALGGAALLANRRGTAQGVSGSDKAKFTSDPAYQIPGGDESSFKLQDVIVKSPKVRKVPIGRMRGAGTDEAAIAGQETRANYAKNARINAMNTAEGSPMIDNPYRAPVRPRGRLINSNRFSKGGRVKGAGCAKRGLGKAFKGGK